MTQLTEEELNALEKAAHRNFPCFLPVHQNQIHSLIALARKGLLYEYAHRDDQEGCLTPPPQEPQGEDAENWMRKGTTESRYGGFGCIMDAFPEPLTPTPKASQGEDKADALSDHTYAEGFRAGFMAGENGNEEHLRSVNRMWDESRKVLKTPSPQDEMQTNSALRDEIAALRSALEFYAANETYEPINNYGRKESPAIWHDQGNRARAALGTPSKG